MSTDREKAERRRHLALLAPQDGERIEEPHIIGCVVPPPPPYEPRPPRKLPAWAKHLRHLQHLKLVD